MWQDGKVRLATSDSQVMKIANSFLSGKISLILSLFRMVELSGGSIMVDGLDISTVPREEIRSRLAGVPQDSYLLNGSVRLNADPKTCVTDAAIIDELKSVQLWENVKAKGGLSTDIDKIALSQGQRQIFCLARAMLRPSTILILDEVTSRSVPPVSIGEGIDVNGSSVDAKTDDLMQRVIREKFSKHTVIAVAHKLDTILDFDKVTFLDRGVLIEFDNPYDLLEQPESAFYKLFHSSRSETDEADFDDTATSTSQ